MQTQVPLAADAAQLANIQKKLQLDNRIRTGINWFFWIAGLSLVNSAAYLFGTTWTFVIGLGVTQLLDSIIARVVQDLGESWDALRVVGTGADLLIAGLFVLIGYFGRKRMRWPVVAGMVLYALDGLLVLIFGDFIGALFHGLALYGIWSGLRAMQQLELLQQTDGGEPVESLRQRSAAALRAQITPGQMRLRLILVVVIVFILVILPFVLSGLQR